MEQPRRIDMLVNMLAEEPDDLFLNYAAGLEYAGGGQPDKAEILFKKVIRLDQNYVTAYYQLGKLYESQLKATKALEYYRLGLEKAHLTKNYKAINELGEAIFLLED